jgi:hypothetical protein
LGGLVLGAFIVTLAFTSWREGLWHSAEPPASAVPEPHEDAVAPARPVASLASDPSPQNVTSTPPSAVTPTPAAMNPTPAAAPPDSSAGQSLYEQNVNPGVDIEAMKRDRGVQHSPGSH